MRGENRVHLRGFTGGEPEVYQGEGFTVVSVSLATDESYVNKQGDKVEHTEWHKLVFKNALGDVVQNYIRKGSHISVVGTLRTESWEKEDGSKASVTKISVKELYIISTPKEADGNDSTDSEDTKAKGKTKAVITGGKGKVAKTKYDDDLPY